MGFAGDVFLNREHPTEVFREVPEIRQAPDVLFANLESAYTDHPVAVPSGYYVMCREDPGSEHLRCRVQVTRHRVLVSRPSRKPVA